MVVRARAAARPSVRIVHEQASGEELESGFEGLSSGAATEDPAGADSDADSGAARARRARDLLGEVFVADLLADWREHGAETIGQVRTERPHDYLRLVAGLAAKAPSIEVNELDELDDEQLAARLRAVSARLAAAGVDLGAGAGPAPPARPPGRL